MRKLFFLLVLLSICSAVYAGTWHVGVEAGAAIGFYDQRGGYRATKSFSPSGALEVAIPAEYRFNPWFSANMGIRYIGKSYMTSNTAVGEAAANMRYRYAEHFFELPFTFRFAYEKDAVRLYAGAGWYIGARFMTTEMGMLDLTSLTTEGYFNNFWSVLPLNPETDNFFDAGLIAEAGISYGLTETTEFYINIRYQYSFTSLYKMYQENGIMPYIDTISIVAGTSFRLGG